jgi:hypothetical protein
MKFNIKIIGAMLALTCMAPVHAEFKSGTSLLAELNLEVPNNQLVGMGYIIGVHDAGMGTNHCTASGTSGIQVIKVAGYGIAALTDQQLAAPASTLILQVLRSHWPCDGDTVKPRRRVHPVS